jgi:hypothetical protein
VIKCNQCGKMNATDAVNCQSCGAPLFSTIDGGMSPRSAPINQPELPAWLESLRVGERSAAPTNNESSFSTADFIDEDALPSWMRAGRNDAQGNTGANPPVSGRPSSSPSPTTDDNYPPPTGIPAQSLLDEQSLPSWMRQGGQPDATSAQEKISASNLVQPDNMPDWMKSLQRNQGPSSGEAAKPFSQTPKSTPAQVPPTPQIPMTPQRPSDASFSARDLIDPQSLPSWMVQQGGQNTAPSRERNQASSPNIPVAPANFSQSQPQLPSVNPSTSGQAGFSARDLIDPQSLPSWMVQQGGQSAQPQGREQSRQSGQLGQPVQPPYGSQPDPFGNSGQPRQQTPGQTFSASSLLDVNSLPSWLRESGQQGGQVQGPSGAPANQTYQPPATNAPAGSSGHISASSFLDVNALPEWMRQANAQQQQGNSGFNAAPQYGQGQAMPQNPAMAQPNTYAGPPKVENIRVPNRPRNEVNPNENSEVAANVFASMLGVASTAPNYPTSASQPLSNYQQPGTGAFGNPAQSNTGYPMNQPGMPPSGSGNYAAPGMGMIQNTPGMPGNPQQGYAPSNNYGGNYQGGMSNSQMGNPSSANMPYASNSGAPASGQNAANEQKNAKKRGLFGAIIEWLTH